MFYIFLGRLLVNSLMSKDASQDILDGVQSVNTFLDTIELKQVCIVRKKIYF